MPIKFDQDRFFVKNRSIEGKNILEIGAGQKSLFRKYFSEKNQFTSSNVNPDYGYQMIDVNNFKSEYKYDLIL